MKKRPIFTVPFLDKHPIIVNVFVTTFCIFILVGSMLSGSNALGVAMLPSDQWATTDCDTTWLGIMFIAHGLLYVHEAYTRRFDPPVRPIVCLASFGIFTIAAILIFVLPVKLVSLAIAGYAYFIVLLTKRVIAIIYRKSRAEIVFNAFIILFFLVSIVFLYIFMEWNYLIMIYLALMDMVYSLGLICVTAFSKMKFSVLMNVVRKTYAAEIFLGMLSLVVAFSIIFYYTEDGFVTIMDSIWYCFAVITTIGFGDISVKSIFARILSIILGTYGIIVVALITSIIVNFYNETKDEKTEEALKEGAEEFIADDDAVPPEVEETPKEEVKDDRPVPATLTAEDIRQIIREELDARDAKQNKD